MIIDDPEKDTPVEPVDEPEKDDEEVEDPGQPIPA